jgi:hypothetical protein
VKETEETKSGGITLGALAVVVVLAALWASLSVLFFPI